ncbi:MAG TPA: response regulator [Pirellulales bacterium]|jgi:DNA-binding NarL/FixJ family response regulator|nr:response regulator [Pirellulales bacterium]
MIMPVNTTVCVVDPVPEDYAHLTSGKSGGPTRFEFINSGRDALRHNAQSKPDVWIINLRLPDMSGVDLREMLSARTPDVPCYLVGDDYRPEDELDARRCGATMYFCKPVRREWVVNGSNENS